MNALKGMFSHWGSNLDLGWILLVCTLLHTIRVALQMYGTDAGRLEKSLSIRLLISPYAPSEQRAHIQHIAVEQKKGLRDFAEHYQMYHNRRKRNRKRLRNHLILAVSALESMINSPPPQRTVHWLMGLGGPLP